MQNDKLQHTAKAHEMFGRLIDAIGNDPNKLEMSKALIKQQTGVDLSSVTLEQLPILKQQGISQQQQLENEMAERKALADKARADQAQSNQDRTYDLNVRRTDILSQKANKAKSPKPLTGEQRKAQSYLDVMQDASESSRAVLPSDEAESPMGATSSFVTDNLSDEAGARYRSKEQNQFHQAAEQWVIAKLRHQSGATISPDEIRKERRIFWPVPGDDIQTRRNKAKARLRVERSLGFEATGEVAQPGNNLNEQPQDDWSDIKILSEE
jgi:hypothetical protein